MTSNDASGGVSRFVGVLTTLTVMACIVVALILAAASGAGTTVWTKASETAATTFGYESRSIGYTYVLGHDASALPTKEDDLASPADDVEVGHGSPIDAGPTTVLTLQWFLRAGVAANSTEDLLGALAASGVKHTPESIVGIARDATGRVVFLETGNARAGLTHILERHSTDFARAGVAESDIASLVVTAASRGNVVGMQGTRPIYEVLFGGRTTRVAITVGDNGFIVGANPVG